MIAMGTKPATRLFESLQGLTMGKWLKVATIVALILILVTTLVGCGSTRSSQHSKEVTLPDSNLDAAIKEAITKPEGPVSTSDMECFTALDASERGIAHLTRLKHCTSLTELGLPAPGVLAAEPVGEQWDKTFGGSDKDVGYSVQQTSDGGYIITGYTDSYGAGSSDVWLIKTDSEGNEQWDKTFGGSDNDFGYSVQQTSDGGYVIAGYTDSYGAGEWDVWLIKTDSEGNEQWDSTFGGSGEDVGYSVQQTSDGGYIMAGSTRSYGVGYSDVWLIKTDSEGNEQWDKTFGGSDDDFGYSVRQTPDGGYIIAGWTASYGAGPGDVWLIKTDSNGNELWNNTFGDSDWERGYCVRQTSDGGYVIAGVTQPYGTGSSDVRLIKADSRGNELWNNTFGGSDWERGYSVQQTSDGGYVIAGVTQPYGTGSSDVQLIKTDSEGNEQWDKTCGGSGDDYGRSVQQTSDGGYVIAGDTGSYGAGEWDVWLIKTDSEGVVTGISAKSSAVRWWVGVAASTAILVVGAVLLLRKRKRSRASGNR